MVQTKPCDTILSPHSDSQIKPSVTWGNRPFSHCRHFDMSQWGKPRVSRMIISHGCVSRQVSQRDAWLWVSVHKTRTMERNMLNGIQPCVIFIIYTCALPRCDMSQCLLWKGISFNAFHPQTAPLRSLSSSSVKSHLLSRVQWKQMLHCTMKFLL